MFMYWDCQGVDLGFEGCNHTWRQKKKIKGTRVGMFLFYFIFFYIYLSFCVTFILGGGGVRQRTDSISNSMYRRKKYGRRAPLSTVCCLYFIPLFENVIVSVL